LDRGYPRDQLVEMIEDARPVAVIGKGDMKGIRSGEGVRYIDLEEEREEIEGRSEEEPGVEVDGERLAYVMYRSGWTGARRGMGIPQRAITRLVKETNYIKLGGRKRIAQISNASFDAATFEVWGGLLNGGKVVIVEKEVGLSPKMLGEFIREEEIEVLFMTT